MNAVERRLKIKELLIGEEFMDLRSLCYRLRASQSTVRRDLETLERTGLAKRVHGGVVPALSQPGWAQPAEPAPTDRHKRAIAGVAAELVQDGQTVILDGGTTVAEVARALLGRNLQIVTNSVPIAGIFYDSRNVEVTLTGGYLYPRLGVMLGPFCEQMLGTVRADLLVMGIGGVTEKGFYNANALIVQSERKMIEVSKQVIIVADHTKFGRDAMAHLAPLDAAHLVITDGEIAEEHVRLLEKAGVAHKLAS